MRTRLAGTVMLSIVVFIVVTLFVSVGVLWWTGDGNPRRPDRSDLRHGSGLYGPP